YSDTINVTLNGTVADVAVTINGLSHTSVSELDFLLVAPDGTHNLEFFSDAGGAVTVTGINVTVADYGTNPLPNGSGLVTGTYKATDYGLPAEANSDFGLSLSLNHATTSGTATFASAFGGASANGNWTLYVRDGQSGAVGSFTGWSLSISLSNVAPVL